MKEINKNEKVKKSTIVINRITVQDKNKNCTWRENEL